MIVTLIAAVARNGVIGREGALPWRLPDDLANQMMGQAGALGLLNLHMPAAGGTFDSADIAMSLPPMISGDPADGKMKVILGDMFATFKFQGTAVGKRFGTHRTWSFRRNEPTLGSDNECSQ